MPSDCPVHLASISGSVGSRGTQSHTSYSTGQFHIAIGCREQVQEATGALRGTQGRCSHDQNLERWKGPQHQRPRLLGHLVGALHGDRETYTASGLRCGMDRVAPSREKSPGLTPVLLEETSPDTSDRDRKFTIGLQNFPISYVT